MTPKFKPGDHVYFMDAKYRIKPAIVKSSKKDPETEEYVYTLYNDGIVSESRLSYYRSDLVDKVASKCYERIREARTAAEKEIKEAKAILKKLRKTEKGDK